MSTHTTGIDAWSTRSAIGNRKLQLHMRRRAKERKPCQYCQQLVGVVGLGQHEKFCTGRPLRTPADWRELDPCACGQFKPRNYPTCWRCVGRSPELLRLDVLLRERKEINSEWRGGVMLTEKQFGALVREELKRMADKPKAPSAP